MKAKLRTILALLVSAALVAQAGAVITLNWTYPGPDEDLHGFAVYQVEGGNTNFLTTVTNKVNGSVARSHDIVVDQSYHGRIIGYGARAIDKWGFIGPMGSTTVIQFGEGPLAPTGMDWKLKSLTIELDVGPGSP